MKILIPFTPHLASESLEMLDQKNIDNWPKLDEKLIKKQKVKIAKKVSTSKELASAIMFKRNKKLGDKIKKIGVK